MRRKELKRYREAARRIIQEEYLNNAISRSDTMRKNMYRRMICLKVCGSKQQYVFDPALGVSIGRNNAENDICLPDLTVSGNHCRLVLYNDQIWLQDRNSANGTLVKHGLRKPVLLHGTQIALENRDRIIVGSTEFRIIMFFCDMLSI